MKKMKLFILLSFTWIAGLQASQDVNFQKKIQRTQELIGKQVVHLAAFASFGEIAKPFAIKTCNLLDALENIRSVDARCAAEKAATLQDSDWSDIKKGYAQGFLNKKN